jgi:WD40 repeat protein
MNLRKKAFTVFIEVLFGLTITAVATMAPLIQWDIQTDARVISLSETGHERANTVAFSPNGDLIAAGTSTGVFLFDASTYQQLRFVSTGTWVRALAFSPDGSLLATGSYDPVVRLWRVSDGDLEAELKGHTAWVRSIAFSPNGRLVASASDDDTVRLWDLSTGGSIQIVQQGVEGVRAVAFSPDGEIFATGGVDSIVRLWRVDDGSLLRELTGHKGWVRALAFSPNGSMLTSGGFDTNVILWSVDDGELLHTMEDHASSVLSLAFSPDGSLLASGSVDKTVRLWQIPMGESFDLLSGHTDFVFGVGFSPDGNSLVSASVDNTIRIWQVAGRVNPLAQEQVSSPSNCVACHHPSGINVPARVIEPGCSTCHGDQALVRNWCPWFPRTPGGTTIGVSAEYLLMDAGVTRSSQNLVVTIATPGNGEHLYNRQGPIVLIPVRGMVYSVSAPMDEIQVSLEIQSSSGNVETLSAKPKADGTFSFFVNLRPDGNQLSMGSFNTQSNCLVCHTQAQVVLPVGNVHLVVTATAPDGSVASDERVIVNDNSTVQMLTVQLLFENGQPAKAVPVQALTRLYEWRGRTFTQTSNEQGYADLEVETLSTVPTIYQVSVPPVVIDGIWYESAEPASVTLLPGEAEISVTTIQVREITGQITGTIADVQEPVQVLAVHLPDGETVSTQSTGQGEFSFANLPIGLYEIAAIEDGNLQHASVDLTQSPTASVELPSVSPGGIAITGQITDANDNWLPFAWVSAHSTENETDAATGTYTLSGLPEGAQTITANAPGFFSQSQRIDTADHTSIDLSLVLRPETKTITWGDGEIIIPAETVANEENGFINFEQGWLWGEGQSEKPITIELGDITINLKMGRFAIEKKVGQSGWLYLFDGEATVNWGTNSQITVTAGEMINLGGTDPIRATQYNPFVVRALRAGSGVPISDVWQPSLEVLISNWVGSAVVFIAQAITLITYVAAFLVLLAFPFAIVKQLLGRSQKRKNRSNFLKK